MWRIESIVSCIESGIAKEIRMESTISTKTWKPDRKEGVTVMETLAPERYREAHIPWALNIPPERIKEVAPQLLPNKDAEIITYCTNTHWHASEYAARELAAMGYKNVAHYPEGKQGWMGAGLPVGKLLSINSRAMPLLVHRQKNCWAIALRNASSPSCERIAYIAFASAPAI
jgi:rhodanese-related sulfurtransferase